MTLLEEYRREEAIAELQAEYEPMVRVTCTRKPQVYETAILDALINDYERYDHYGEDASCEVEVDDVVILANASWCTTTHYDASSNSYDVRCYSMSVTIESCTRLFEDGEVEDVELDIDTECIESELTDYIES